MKEIFETFRPNNLVVKKYVDFYYLDLKPDNDSFEFECFPHYNNTISIYKSHIRLANGVALYKENAQPLHIFTPIREKILRVRQVGKVHRIVIVFNPFGIQQFYRNLEFNDYILHKAFLNQEELDLLFRTLNPTEITSLIDGFLEKRFRLFENPTIEKSIQYIFEYYDSFSVHELSVKLDLSRQHLNRIFRQHLGVSIKKFHEIVLFRKTMDKKLSQAFNGNYTNLTYEFNFSDQAHFNKMYKKLTKYSPKLFFDRGSNIGDDDIFWHIQ